LKLFSPFCVCSEHTSISGFQLKGIVQNNILNVAENVPTLKPSNYVDEFVSSSTNLEKCSITSLAPHLDPLQCMGAVRMRVQTADKNITIIHITPFRQLTSCEAKSCVFVRNRSIITVFWLSWEFISENINYLENYCFNKYEQQGITLTHWHLKMCVLS